MKVQRDALYLFLCHLEWHNWANLGAYKELVAALDDQEPDIRQVAESLLHRRSPRPKWKKHQSVMECPNAPVRHSPGKADRDAS